MPAVVAQRLRVEHVDVVLDRVDRGEVARHRRAKQRGDERARVEQPERGVRLDAVVHVVEELDRLAMAGDDDVAPADDVEPRRRIRLAIVRFDRDPDVEVRPVDAEVRDVARVLERIDGRRMELERVRHPPCLPASRSSLMSIQRSWRSVGFASSASSSESD